LTIIISLNKENLQCLCNRIDQDGMVLFLNQFATMTKVKKRHLPSIEFKYFF